MTAYLMFSKAPKPLTLFFFFFNDTATTEIYTLSLHDALPISVKSMLAVGLIVFTFPSKLRSGKASNSSLAVCPTDRKSTRLNSSHDQISYAVFCLKKKINNVHQTSSLTTPPRDPSPTLTYERP